MKVKNPLNIWKGVLKLLVACATLPLVYFSYTTLQYFWFDTPAVEYALDILGLRNYFLPDLRCDKCNDFQTSWTQPNADVCRGQPVFLLIAVTSFHVNLNARRAIRKTWASEHSYNGKRILTLFFFGKHEDKNMNSLVETEMKKYGDIVQTNIKEDYRLLTNKTMSMLQWIQTFCPSAEFVLKTDDDSFNIPQNFASYLGGRDGHKNPFVGGYCFTVLPDRRISSKFYVGEEMYPLVYYPTYCSGPGYVLSMFSVNRILAVAPDVKFIPMEDVFTTGACRAVAKLSYTNIKGCIIDRREINKCSASSWAKNSHNVVPEVQLDMWNGQVIDASFFRHCVLSWTVHYAIPVVILILVLFFIRNRFLRRQLRTRAFKQ